MSCCLAQEEVSVLEPGVWMSSSKYGPISHHLMAARELADEGGEVQASIERAIQLTRREYHRINLGL